MKNFSLDHPIRHETAAYARAHEADSACVKVKLALERWENEGGRIPEVARIHRWPIRHAREFAAT